MNKRMIHSVLLVMGIIFSHAVFAMDIPTLKNVSVASSIEFDEITGLYKYSYILLNPSTNTGQISSVQIDIARPPQNLELSAEGLIIQKGFDPDGVMLKGTFKEVLAKYGSRMQKPIVPVGIETPSGWGGGISVMGTAHWGSDEKKYRIMPGQELNNFRIISRGIPTIRDISIHPKWVYVTEGYITEEESKEADRIKEQITFRTMTLGPTAPPKELKPVDFLNNIIAMKHEAFKLGWITSDAIVLALDQKLEAARKKLEQGNKKAASEILKAFINEVEAQGCESYEVKCPPGKHLKPEAYALLKYNAQYLVDNLK